MNDRPRLERTWLRKEKKGRKWLRFAMLIFMVGKLSLFERTHNSNILSAFSSPINVLTMKKNDGTDFIFQCRLVCFIFCFFVFSWLSSAPVQEIKLLRPKIISKIKKKKIKKKWKTKKRKKKESPNADEE